MSERLLPATKILYGIADLGLAMVTSSINFFLLFFYTDVLNIDPGLAGTAAHDLPDGDTGQRGRSSR